VQHGESRKEERRKEDGEKDNGEEVHEEVELLLRLPPLLL
jgi:hypothetical protein